MNRRYEYVNYFFFFEGHVQIMLHRRKEAIMLVFLTVCVVEVFKCRIKCMAMQFSPAA
jgi:hypothetical protein